MKKVSICLHPDFGFENQKILCKQKTEKKGVTWSSRVGRSFVLEVNKVFSSSIIES